MFDAAQGANSPAGPSTSAHSPSGTTWAGLHHALQALRISSKVCPPLSGVVGDLADCLPIFEAAAKNRKDYEELGSGLKTMVQVLSQYLNDETSESVPNTIKSIVAAITREIESIDKRQLRNGLRQVYKAVGDEEDLIRRYRRVEQLFRQLQGEVSLSTWSISSKHLVNTQLESLRPAKLAKYNSELSMEVSRRTCTENTRSDILENLGKWTEDKSMASIYWMNGMAGTGKTTIAYSMCVLLEANKQLAASFFCTRTSPECRDARRIVPTIAYQLARGSTPFRSALCKALEEDPDIGSGHISVQFNQMLRDPLLEARGNMPNNLVVVVDALDECNDPYIIELFLGLLFRSAADLPIKFFVTSRPEPAIRQRMMLEGDNLRDILYLHEIDELVVQADIKLYLNEELAPMSPPEDSIEKLSEHAGNLFIYAATAIRYIRPPGRSVNFQERLATVLSVDAKRKKSLSALDALYSAILTAAIESDELEPEEQERMRLVLWTTICACEPVLVDTLSAISGINSNNEAMIALEPLLSVLHVSDRSNLVTALHASFPDFITSRERSGKFFCDVSTHSQLVSEQCFEIMKTQLRFNICCIPSSFMPDSKIPNLNDQIVKNIPEELFYACRFWPDHLVLVESDSYILKHFHEFLAERLLFWMEVLNLKKCMLTGVAGTTKASAWINREVDAHSELRKLASDVQAFVVNYASHPISNFTPHIYLSALPFGTPFPHVMNQYMSRFRGLIEVSGTAMMKIQPMALGAWESRSPIHAAAFSADGTCIVLGDDKGKICIRNAHDGNYTVAPFKAHKKLVTCIGVSNDGTLMASSSHDMTLSIWSTRDGSLVSGPYKGHTSRVTSVGFSLDDAHIVSGSNDCTVGIWAAHDASSRVRSLAGHTKGVNSVAFSPNGVRVVSGSKDHTIRIWDPASGATIFILEGHTSAVTSVQFSTDGAWIISGSNDRLLRVWNADDGTPIGQPFKGHSQRITSIAVSPDGEHIVSGSFDCTVRVWSRHTGKVIAGPFEGHTDGIRSIAFSEDGARIISASDDKTVRIWNAHGHKQERKKKKQKAITGIPRNGIRNQQSFLASFSSKYDLLDFMQSAIDLDGCANSLNFGSVSGYKAFAFSPDHAYMAVVHESASFATANFDNLALRVWRFWDPEPMNDAPMSKDMHAPISCLQISSDASRIFSVHTDGSICMWNPKTADLIDGPRPCATNSGFESAVCSVDGTRVITCWFGHGSSTGAELWNVQANHRIAFIATGGIDEDYDSAPLVIFSNEGQKFLTSVPASTHGIIDVWDADDGRHAAGSFVIDSMPRTTCALDFSPDGAQLIYGSMKGLQLVSLTDGTIISAQFKGSNDMSVKFCSNQLVVSITNNTCYTWDVHSRRLTTVFHIPTALLKSITCSIDGRCLIYGNSKTKEDNHFRFWRIQPGSNVPTVTPDGWLQDESQPLFWIPDGLRSEFPGCDALLIRDKSSLRVGYSDIIVGDNWSKCYIGG